MTKLKLRPSVLAFAEAMERELRENDWKGGWDDCTINFLIEKLEEETKELERIVQRDCPFCGKRMRPTEGDTDALSEAADVANIVMMIAEISTKENPPAITEEEAAKGLGALFDD